MKRLLETLDTDLRGLFNVTYRLVGIFALLSHAYKDFLIGYFSTCGDFLIFVHLFGCSYDFSTQLEYYFFI